MAVKDRILSILLTSIANIQTRLWKYDIKK